MSIGIFLLLIVVLALVGWREGVWGVIVPVIGGGLLFLTERFNWNYVLVLGIYIVIAIAITVIRKKHLNKHS